MWMDDCVLQPCSLSIEHRQMALQRLPNRAGHLGLVVVQHRLDEVVDQVKVAPPMTSQHLRGHCELFHWDVFGGLASQKVEMLDHILAVSLKLAKLSKHRRPALAHILGKSNASKADCGTPIKLHDDHLIIKNIIVTFTC